ncbi:MAG: tRNA (adenosine(37)-N6)-threonylcarbamoyltransferase complex ATPase subunit type 1 TsaE [Candidatus Niyogibacteria bacterium]|nr:tRNA (adenosine(37)-N6)-threonylcarbamoyltransferase complex ATPase subunit type 1 TsaE [Candidatus Niyogibacteria bacterium]
MKLMKEIKIITKKTKETQILAGFLAQECLKVSLGKRALVIGLEGELGAGKTYFVKGFAEGLGVKETVVSPTFVLLKIFKLFRKKFKQLIHIDAYRVNFRKELQALGWEKFLKDPQNIIIIEWADKARGILPKNYLQVKFKHFKEDERKIIFKIK